MKNFTAYMMAALLTSLVAVVQNTDAIKDLKELGYLVIAAIFIIFVGIWYVIDTHWLSFRFLRKYIRRYSIEGVWIERLHNHQSAPISYVVIEYEAKNKSFKYYGCNYDSSGNQVAQFESTRVDVSESGDKLTFHFSATMLLVGAEKTVLGKGEITFNSNGSRYYKRGQGEFTEFDNKIKTVNISLIKADKDILNEIGKSVNNPIVRIEKLVKHYLGSEWFKYVPQGNVPERV